MLWNLHQAAPKWNTIGNLLLPRIENSIPTLITVQAELGKFDKRKIDWAGSTTIDLLHRPAFVELLWQQMLLTGSFLSFHSKICFGRGLSGIFWHKHPFFSKFTLAAFVWLGTALDGNGIRWKGNLLGARRAGHAQFSFINFTTTLGANHCLAQGCKNKLKRDANSTLAPASFWLW